MDYLLCPMALCGRGHHFRSPLMGEPRCYDEHIQGIGQGHTGEEVTGWFSARVHGVSGRATPCPVDYHHSIGLLLGEPIREISYLPMTLQH